MKMLGSQSSLTRSRLTGIMAASASAVGGTLVGAATAELLNMLRKKASVMRRRGSRHSTLKYELNVTEYSCMSEKKVLPE